MNDIEVKRSTGVGGLDDEMQASSVRLTAVSTMK
jgi:hypothetical protein